MNRAEFNAWCAAGKPALKASQPRDISTKVQACSKSQVDECIRAAVAGERANLQASLETLALIIGEECGRNEKALRTEIDALRAEVSTLRRETR